MRLNWRIPSLLLGLLLFADRSFADGAVREETLLLPIEVGSQSEKLETLIVRPVDGNRFPIVLIVNGSAAGAPSAMHPEWLAAMAHDFAHRGWLAASVVWPGYGNSTGKFVDEAGNCSAPNVARFLNMRGSELAGALTALRKRPDVDPSIALGLGISIGGASMLDLAARPDRPLTAAINISGGVYHYEKVGVPASDCERFQADLVRNMANFGKNNPTPTLWFYAANDPYFGPDLASKMVASYRSQGGQADFVALPPFGTNGHTLFKQTANPLTKPKIDDFLRQNHLPAMDDAAMVPLLSKIRPEDRANVQRYVESATEKAMAMPEHSKGIYWYYGARSLEGARNNALANCQKATGKTCHLVAENSHLLDGWEDVTEGNK
jgi:dienelactone hydrolase